VTTTTSPIGACTLTTVYDASGYPVSQCIDCPEIPAVVAVPERTITDPRYGWNASARSRVQLAGDCYTQFEVPAHAMGVVCGFAGEHRGPDPRDVSHGFYVYQDAGRELWRVVEAGLPVTAPIARTPGELFRLERRPSGVSYFVNNRRVYASAAPAAPALLVVACLFAASDGVN
jgi:hypothetical protein